MSTSIEQKLDLMELERFSISSLNLFRTNRISWYLRYILNFKSVYPMQSAWRGQAIEGAINNYIDKARAGKTSDENELIDYAIHDYQSRILTSLFKIYPKTLDGFDLDKMVILLKGKSKDEFPSILKTIVEGHFTINKSLEVLPEFLIPESEEYFKFLKKSEKQYDLIIEATSGLYEYFKTLPIEEVRKQGKISANNYDIPIPTIGYFDYEFPDFGIDLKSCDPVTFPKKWDDVSLSYKCQSAFYSKTLKKPWKIVYGSRLSKDSKKENEILSIFKSGIPLDKIAQVFKEKTGSGTTKPTIEKILNNTLQGTTIDNWDPKKPIAIFDLPENEIEHYDNINKFTAKSILMAIESSRKNSLEEDMKYFCLSDTEHMFISPDEAEIIKKTYGFTIPTELTEE